MKLDQSLLQSYHLDNIRIKRGMTVEHLTEGICTDRQYRRYVSGDSILRLDMLNKFCDKLNIGINDFFYSLVQKDHLIYTELVSAYRALNNKNFDQCIDILKEIDVDSLDLSNKNFYDFIYLKLQHEKKVISDINVMSKLIESKIYENLFKTEIYDFIDILYIHLISQIEVKTKKKDAFNLLIKLLDVPEHIYISTENKFMLPPIFANTSIILGRLNEVDESLAIATRGIEFCLNHKLSHALPNLYYVQMLGFRATNRKEEMYVSAVKCLSSCIATDMNLYQTFYDLIKKDLGIDPSQLFTHIDL